MLSAAKDIKYHDDEKRKLALKYGYIYFIQKQIPLLPTINEDLLIDFNKLDYLIPGKNKFMDFICDRIIDGEDFVLPEELVEKIHFFEKDQIIKFA